MTRSVALPSNPVVNVINTLSLTGLRKQTRDVNRGRNYNRTVPVETATVYHGQATSGCSVNTPFRNEITGKGQVLKPHKLVLSFHHHPS